MLFDGDMGAVSHRHSYVRSQLQEESRTRAQRMLRGGGLDPNFLDLLKTELWAWY